MKNVYACRRKWQTVGQVQWEAAPQAEPVFTDFERTIGRAAAMVEPGDYVLVLGECSSCSSAVFQTAAPDLSDKQVAYDVFPEASARELQEELQASPPVCPSCQTPMGPPSLRNLHIARVAPLRADVLWLNFAWADGGWNAPEYLLFSPPDGWLSLGENPASESVFDAWGRAAHTVLAGISAYRGAMEGEQLAVRGVTQESALIAFDGRTPPKNEKILSAMNERGVPPPYLQETWSGGMVPDFLEHHGVDDAVRRMLGARTVGLALVVSEPALRTRLAEWGRATSGAVSIDLQGRIALRKSVGSERTSLARVIDLLTKEGVAPDDVVYSLGIREVPVTAPERKTHGLAQRHTQPLAAIPLRSPPHPALEPPTPTPPVVASGTPRALPPAAPAAHGPTPATGQVRPCISCGRETHFVRRIFDTSRLDALYKPRPVLFERKLSYSTALMMTCGEHLRPVSEPDLEQWGITEAIALSAVHKWMPTDELTAFRRVHFTKKHQPIVGLVGAFISSVAAHDLWLEQALRATMVNVGNPVKVECVGENVITFRPIKQADLEKVGRDLRRHAKSWGLPEPIIPFSLTKKFVRPPTAIGRIVIKGSL